MNSIDLEDSVEIFKKVNPNIIKTNSNWHFSKCDPRFGIKYPGRIPGQIYINLYYFFTNKNDYILDVFCGGGTGIDTGKFMERNVIGLDLNPIREDIINFDVLIDKNPFNRNVFQLIFLDPPYFNINKGKYTNFKTDLSNLNLDDFLDAIELITTKFYQSLKNNGYYSIIISNKREKGDVFYDLGFLVTKTILKYFTQIHRISVPYENTAYHNEKWRKICLERKKILIGTRDLLIFKKKKTIN